MLESARRMSLPVSEVERELLIRAASATKATSAPDGLWDIEAHLIDIKNHDYHAEDRRAPRRPADSRHVAAPDHRPQASPCATPQASTDACRIRAAARRSRRRTEAGRPEPDARLSQATLQGAARRRARLHPSHRDACLPADRRRSRCSPARRRRSEDDGTKPFQLDQCHALETSTRDREASGIRMVSRQLATQRPSM